MKHFEVDHERICSNPDDYSLIDFVQRRVNATEPILKRQIVDRLINEMLETNPLSAFELIMSRPENKEKYLIIKDLSDPFFEC